ncbi:phasin family protein [Micromonospora sp. LOL_021]|uniref:phasin family protein n=1 Tax=Micromonospora sp. LOL_021 TaxID=3345417 RepID=UPI003A842ACF
MRDAWRAYLELALGLTEASRKKAEQTARSLVGKGGATAAQLQAVAEDLLSAGTANRESLTRLVRAEVDRALGAMGLVKAEEVVALRDRIDRLEADMERARSRAAAASAAAATAEAAIPPSAEPAVVKKAAAKNAVAKKAVAKKAAASKTVDRRSDDGSAGGQ